jgi:hypothetical protein
MRHRGDRQRCSIENAGSMSGSPPCRTSSSEAVQSVGAVLSGARAPSAMSCGSWWSTCPRTRSLLCCPRHVGIWPRRRRGPGRRRSSVPGVPVGVTWPSGPRNFSTTASAALRDPLRHGPDRGRRSRRRRSIAITNAWRSGGVYVNGAIFGTESAASPATALAEELVRSPQVVARAWVRRPGAVTTTPRTAAARATSSPARSAS